MATCPKMPNITRRRNARARSRRLSRDLEDKITRAQIIDPTTLSGDKIVFGATVTLLDENDKPIKYQIVGMTEADANKGRISYNSPIAPCADRQGKRRRDRSHRAVRRQVLPRREDRVHLTGASTARIKRDGRSRIS